MKTITIEDDDGQEHELPTKFAVCPTCDGHGTHLTPSIRDHAYTPEEFYESFDDEEREHYFNRGGMYDVRCEECHGARVVPVVDEDRCPPDLLKLWHRQQENLAHMYAEMEAERRFGA